MAKEVLKAREVVPDLLDAMMSNQLRIFDRADALDPSAAYASVSGSRVCQFINSFGGGSGSVSR
jgi:hypothetical protein